MIILNYILIGVLIVFAMEVWFNPTKYQETKPDNQEDFKFDWFKRVVKYCDMASYICNLFKTLY